MGAGRPEIENPMRKVLRVGMTQTQYDAIKGVANRRDSTMSEVLRQMIEFCTLDETWGGLFQRYFEKVSAAE